MEKLSFHNKEYYPQPIGPFVWQCMASLNELCWHLIEDLKANKVALSQVNVRPLYATITAHSSLYTYHVNLWPVLPPPLVQMLECCGVCSERHAHK